MYTSTNWITHDEVQFSIIGEFLAERSPYILCCEWNFFPGVNPQLDSTGPLRPCPQGFLPSFLTISSHKLFSRPFRLFPAPHLLPLGLLGCLYCCHNTGTLILIVRAILFTDYLIHLATPTCTNRPFSMYYNSNLNSWRNTTKEVASRLTDE